MEFFRRPAPPAPAAALVAAAFAAIPALFAGASEAHAGEGSDHLLVLTSDGVTGNCATIELALPWNVTANREPVGSNAVARHALGLHWVVNGSPDDDVQVIDPATFDTIRQFGAGAGTDPRDIAVVDAGRAYVSRHDSPWVLLVNPSTGAAVDSVDLGGFADADGLPDCGWMELDGSHLFVQVQRLDRAGSGTTVPPALLAVIDVDSNSLVDVDPGTPGVQGIELAGPIPSTKMRRNEVTRRLTVSTPGIVLDGTGGVEEIDLDALTNLGFLVAETQFPLAIGAHVVVSPSRGYLIGHTDFGVSSHLDAFAVPGGAFLGEPYTTSVVVTSIAYDETGGTVFFPDPLAGVFVFDAATGDTLAGPLATGLPPGDLVVARQDPAVSVPLASTAAAMRLVVIPNPTNTVSRIVFRAPRTGRIDAALFDVRGRLVRRLAGEAAERGDASLAWNGEDAGGRPVAPGVYVVRVTGDGFRATTKVHRVR